MTARDLKVRTSLRLTFPDRATAQAVAVGLFYPEQAGKADPARFFNAERPMIPATGRRRLTRKGGREEDAEAIWYDAAEVAVIMPTGETDPETGRPVFAPKEGLHVIVQVRQEAGVLTIPEAIRSFVVADAGAERWPIFE